MLDGCDSWVCADFVGCREHLDLHSFPTRRSSDLNCLKGPLDASGTSSAKANAPQAPRPRKNTPSTAIRHPCRRDGEWRLDRKSTRLNSSHLGISYAVFCLKKKTMDITVRPAAVGG